MYDRLDLPQLARPAFVSWQSGAGRQDFPVDPIADAVRDRDARAKGLVKVRRIPGNQAAHSPEEK